MAAGIIVISRMSVFEFIKLISYRNTSFLTQMYDDLDMQLAQHWAIGYKLSLLVNYIFIVAPVQN